MNSAHLINDIDLERHPLTTGDTEARSRLVEFRNVGICFHRHHSFFEILRGHRRPSSEFWALRNVSFGLSENDKVGVIGRNGSGKSTLSLLCARVFSPDEGVVRISGSVHLLTIGLGFQRDLTGRENVHVSGGLLGLNRKDINRLMPDIEEFADIGDFMDEPVRTYSTGMKARLGFAIATVVRSDILLLDEVLATGDQAFSDKAMARIRNLRDMAKCVVLVTHSVVQVRELCNRAIWLDRGGIVMDGSPDEVVSEYVEFCRSPAEYRKENPAVFVNDVAFNGS